MKTAEEVLAIIRELPPEERQKIAEYMNADEEKFLEENYSPEDVAKILKSGEEAERGINVSPELERTCRVIFASVIVMPSGKRADELPTLRPIIKRSL